jgi:hypothetical protein
MMLNDATIPALQPLYALAIPIEGLAPVVLTTLVFVLLGLLVFALAFVIIVKASPFSVRKELADDQNVALAIVIGSVIIGSAIIVAAAIHG